MRRARKLTFQNQTFENLHAKDKKRHQRSASCQPNFFRRLNYDKPKLIQKVLQKTHLIPFFSALIFQDLKKLRLYLKLLIQDFQNQNLSKDKNPNEAQSQNERSKQNFVSFSLKMNHILALLQKITCKEEFTKEIKKLEKMSLRIFVDFLLQEEQFEFLKRENKLTFTNKKIPFFSNKGQDVFPTIQPYFISLPFSFSPLMLSTQNPIQPQIFNKQKQPSGHESQQNIVPSFALTPIPCYYFPFSSLHYFDLNQGKIEAQKIKQHIQGNDPHQIHSNNDNVSKKTKRSIVEEYTGFRTGKKPKNRK